MVSGDVQESLHCARGIVRTEWKPVACKLGVFFLFSKRRWICKQLQREVFAFPFALLPLLSSLLGCCATLHSVCHLAIACSLQYAGINTLILPIFSGWNPSRWLRPTFSSPTIGRLQYVVNRVCQMIPVDFLSRHVLLSDWSGQWSYGIAWPFVWYCWAPCTPAGFSGADRSPRPPRGEGAPQRVPWSSRRFRSACLSLPRALAALKRT